MFGSASLQRNLASNIYSQIGEISFSLLEFFCSEGFIIRFFILLLWFRDEVGGVKSLDDGVASSLVIDKLLHKITLHIRPDLFGQHENEAIDEKHVLDPLAVGGVCLGVLVLLFVLS